MNKGGKISKCIFIFINEEIDRNLCANNFPFLKVSKSQKQFFLKLHCPKSDRNFSKGFLP